MKKLLTLFAILAITTPLITSAQLNDPRIEARERFRAHLDGENVEVRTQAEVRVNSNEIQPEERQAEIRARIEARKANLAENREEIRARLEIRAKENVSNLIDNIFNRFENVLNRFERVNVRISEHIERFEENGIDVSASLELFREAKAQLEITKEVILETEEVLKTELENETISRDNIFAAVRTAKESIKTTHQAYVEVIVSLRASQE